MMAVKPGLLAFWPWHRLGGYKYVCFYVPVMLKAAQVSLKGGNVLKENVWFHLLLASALRYVHIHLWTSLIHFHGIIKRHKIQTDGISFEQKDRESHWDNYIILQLLAAACMITYAPGFKNLPLWSGLGMVCLLLLHAGPTEFLYYWAHRTLHESPTLYKRYHAYHHAASIPEPTSGFMLTFAEHLGFTALVSIPLLGVGLLGLGSVGMFYCYWVFLDIMLAIGHCNWEFVPAWTFRAFPFLRNLVYTPTYHSLHHSRLSHNTNYALSMPLYDHLAGTFDNSTDSEHASIREGRNEAANKPDFVFLVHEVGLDSCLQLPAFGVISFHTVPFQHRWFVTLLMPITIPVMLFWWVFGKAFFGYEYKLDQYMSQVWIMPRFGFQYFLGFEKARINRLIETAIVEADNMGVKVLALGALNKMEVLNEGGKLFINRLPNLRMRVCHGNTLTAAVILNGLPKDVTEIFLTGATSKLGRAVSLYLAQRGVRVLMLTTSVSRFESIVEECPAKYKGNLAHAIKYKDAQHLKTWVIGKWASAADQRWASAGTKFHQFVVPTIQQVRKDCSYGALAAMHLPKHTKGLDTCEYDLPRAVVHACHAGGLVHTLEGWTHHELGPIPIDRIDIVWRAALKHGFLPVKDKEGSLDLGDIAVGLLQSKLYRKTSC